MVTALKDSNKSLPTMTYGTWMMKTPTRTRSRGLMKMVEGHPLAVTHREVVRTSILMKEKLLIQLYQASMITKRSDSGVSSLKRN
jgi:hypothetical protein